jgi:hypothetical protein
MSTVVADFTHIAGADGTVGQTAAQEAALSINFNTGGIRGERSAILMFSVIPVANPPQPAQADIYINDKHVGSIMNPVQNSYTVQTIAIAKASDAKFKSTDGRDNVFAVKNVPRAFGIKDVVCFYHQQA